MGVPISREPPHGHPPQFFNKGLGYLAISSSTHASRDERFPIARMVMRGILALFFAGAGFAHLLAPHELLKITPDWVPSASAVIFVTGFVELANASLKMRLTPERTSATTNWIPGVLSKRLTEVMAVMAIIY